MNSIIEYFLSVIIVMVVWLLISTREMGFRNWLFSKDAPGILKGIVIAVGVTTILAMLSSCSGTYVNDASVYAGLDYTKNISPQCEVGGADDHTTSNLGLRVNVYESEDGKFRSNSKYTHHSCAFSPDDKSYDAIGLEMEYQLWGR